MWQLCHLAMVVPIADAYYEADCPEKAGKEWKTERKTAKRLKRNFCRFLPLPILTIVLSITFESRFGNKLMYQHAMKAPDEMRGLHRLFYLYTKNISCRKGRRFVQ